MRSQLGRCHIDVLRVAASVRPKKIIATTYFNAENNSHRLYANRSRNRCQERSIHNGDRSIEFDPWHIG